MAIFFVLYFRYWKSIYRHRSRTLSEPIYGNAVQKPANIWREFWVGFGTGILPGLGVAIILLLGERWWPCYILGALMFIGLIWHHRKTCPYCSQRGRNLPDATPEA